MTTFTIVSVSYNSSEIIGSFLAGLGPSVPDSQIIVVDSGSADSQTTREISEGYGAEFVPIARNVGYGAASNLGASFATSDWVVFINPDVAVSLSDVGMMIARAVERGISCIGPLILDSKGDVRTTWGRTIRPPWRKRASGYRDCSDLIYAETISGCCMAVRRLDFLDVGCFDESFFLFCEEMDMHRRLNMAGKSTAVDKTIFAISEGGASSAGVTHRWRLVQRAISHTKYVSKHFTWLEGRVAEIYNLARIAIMPKYRPARISLREYIEGLKVASR